MVNGTVFLGGSFFIHTNENPKNGPFLNETSLGFLKSQENTPIILTL